MATEQSLFERCPAELDLADLHWLLLQRFKGAMQPSPEEVVYPGDATNYCVKVRLGDPGRVTGMYVRDSLKNLTCLGQSRAW